MGFFDKLFGTGSVSFWRKRAESLESEISDLERLRELERERHRIREEFLLDEVLKASGNKPIREKVERELDVNGFEADHRDKLKNKLEEEQIKKEAIEKKAFIEDCVRNGKTEEVAENYWNEHKTEILSQTI